MVVFQVEVASSSVSKIACLFVVHLDGLGVGCDGIRIVFSFEGVIALLFPLLGGLRHLLFIIPFSRRFLPFKQSNILESSIEMWLLN